MHAAIDTRTSVMESTSTIRTRPFRVWCLLRDQFGHVKPVEDFLGEGAEFVYDSSWDPRRMLDADPDIVLCVNDVEYGVSRCLDAARGAGVPSLVIQDGILEWRCQYENPQLGAGGGAPQHQPVLADKIACIGAGSARHIASWGNAGKVEVTGMPRLDSLAKPGQPPRRRSGSRLLVMTAKNPGFTPRQTETTVASLRDLRDYLLSRPEIEVVWRLTKNLAGQLGVANQLTSLEGAELAELLPQVDAVITTPSTSMLEAMIVRRPVACLDYHNVPRFVPTAWTISAPQHVSNVVEELLAPLVAKMLFQQECLRDSLSVESPAAPRVGDLIVRMATLGREAQRTGRGLRLPVVMVASNSPAPAARIPSLAELYPVSDAFRLDNRRLLQVRLARAESENARLIRQQSERRVGYWIRLAGRETARRLKAGLSNGHR